MRLDVRLLEHEPRHDEAYLYWLEYYGMLSQYRDQRWQIAAERAGSIIAAENIDGEWVGGGQSGSGEGIPTQEGVAVAEGWTNQGIAARIGAAIRATHRLRGANTTESLTDAPIPLEITEEMLKQMPEKMRRAIKWHESQGFELAYAMYGWERKNTDVWDDLMREQKELDWEKHPELISQAIRAIAKVHATQNRIPIHPSVYRNNPLMEFTDEPNNIRSLPPGQHPYLWPGTDRYTFCHMDHGDIGTDTYGEDSATQYHRWAVVPQADAESNPQILLRLIDTGRPDEAKHVYSDGLYVMYDKGSDEHKVIDVEDGMAVQADAAAVDYVNTSLVTTAWYLNLTPVQRHLYDSLPLATAILGPDMIADIPLKDAQHYISFANLRAASPFPTPVIRDSQKRKWY